MSNLFSRPDLMSGYPETLKQQEQNIHETTGKVNDFLHTFDAQYSRNGNILFNGQEIPVSDLEKMLKEKRKGFVRTSQKVVDAIHTLAPSAKETFSPFNGAETICSGTEYTLAIDRLPIGTPASVMRLYNNEYARGAYLLDKLDRAHSYTGVIQDIGYVGAALLWDIEDIQQGYVENIEFLDKTGKPVDDIKPDTNPAGIKITYQTADKTRRVHEQYSCKFDSLPEHVVEQLYQKKTDVLYLRGTHNLVTEQEYFDEYKTYVEGVRANGYVVSDSKIEDLSWHMEGKFGDRKTIPLEDDEQFGYAGKKAKIAVKDPHLAFQGHINILQKN